MLEVVPVLSLPRTPANDYNRQRKLRQISMFFSFRVVKGLL